MAGVIAGKILMECIVCSQSCSHVIGWCCHPYRDVVSRQCIARKAQRIPRLSLQGAAVAGSITPWSQLLLCGHRVQRSCSLEARNTVEFVTKRCTPNQCMYHADLKLEVNAAYTWLPNACATK